MILLALAAAAAGTPDPGQLHTFRDWIVGCDNIRTCQANGLRVDGDQDDSPLLPSIDRDGAPAAQPRLTVYLPDGADTGTRIELLVDGAVVNTFVTKTADVTTIALTRPLLNAMANGKTLALRKAGDSKTMTASLAGLAAALLYIDDQQKRSGTTGALKATGPRPDSSVPLPPPMPLIRTPALSSKPPRTIGLKEAAALLGPDNTDCNYGPKLKPEAHRLDATHSAVLLAHPCGNGAYNYFTSVYILGEQGAPQPARFDFAPGMSQDTSEPDVTNGGWDAKTRTLGSYEKGRGLGDCGSMETYAWDGTRFRLIEASSMGECRGSVDYIRVWKARTGN